MVISIKNLLKRTRVFNLETKPFLSHPQNGKGRPCSITFRPLEVKHDLHECILECEEIKNALLPPNRKRKPTLRVMKRYSKPRVVTEEKKVESKSKKKNKKAKK